ncbi:MAG TPA: PhzF family phenazine biosynthesis protein [Rhizomicrobium sp.]|nr:PhzF family phenazine biosynthesis protein [Rhizomicrobium sp.]
MKLKLWQIDAFAQKPFEGNPAAIVPLEEWLDDARMQKIANENNLAETAFFVRKEDGRHDLRWFTPAVEVPLCGHATLASGWLIFSELAPDLQSIAFDTKSGTLEVKRGPDGRHQIALPSDTLKPYGDADYAARIAAALKTRAPKEVYVGRNVFAVFENARDVRAIPGPGTIESLIEPGFGLIATAPGDDGFDFVSRYFAPHHGIPEDPVTGSAHAALTPFWSKRLDKKQLKARQVSPRGGNLDCIDDDGRTLLSGACSLYLKGEITV